MKIIKYGIFQSKREDGTDITSPKEIFCYTQEHFDISYPIAEEEAIDGTIEISGEFDEVSTEPTAQDDTDAMLIDHEYRLTLLELFTDMTV